MEALKTVASESEDESCFCPMKTQIVQEDTKCEEDDGYMNLSKTFGIWPTEQVPPCECTRDTWSIVCVSVYAVLNHCLRISEDCEGCVIDAPGQQHHGCVNWTSEHINCRLRDLCAALPRVWQPIKCGYCHRLCNAESVLNPRKFSAR